jgi:hypothetical protein
MAASTRPLLKWPFVLAAFFLVIITLALIVKARLHVINQTTRAWVVGELSQRFKSRVELDSLQVAVWPKMNVQGRGLTVHFHNRVDVPPVIHIDEFEFNLGLAGLLHSVHHIDNVVLRHLVITLPPRNAGDKQDSSLHDGMKTFPAVVVETMICDNTQLFFLSRKPGKDPLDFEIHNLTLRNVGTGRPFDFQGNLTNAKPKGEIATQGQFGPWDAEEPGETPVSGNYEFSNADLNPLPGIGGILSSTGKYSGPLDELSVDGQTDTPDFSIDPVGHGVPLHTDFSATVNGTDGDTFLHPVHALLGKSVIIANGSVVLVRAKQGHLITLDVNAPAARFEDILSLAVKSAKPPLTGIVKLKTNLVIPPSKERAVDKLLLDGDFESDDARFTSAEVREKLQSLSRHGLGQPADPNAGSAVSGLKGHFHLENAMVTFTHLNFSVEGAAILLDGTYKIHGGELNFHGHLEMKAKLSETMTGAKAVLLKPFDPLFSKGKSGTVIPISITGTRENPTFSVSVFHKTIKRQMGTQKQQR